MPADSGQLGFIDGRSASSAAADAAPAAAHAASRRRPRRQPLPPRDRLDQRIVLRARRRPPLQQMRQVSTRNLPRQLLGDQRRRLDQPDPAEHTPLTARSSIALDARVPSIFARPGRRPAPRLHDLPQIPVQRIRPQQLKVEHHRIRAARVEPRVRARVTVASPPHGSTRPDPAIEHVYDTNRDH